MTEAELIHENWVAQVAGRMHSLPLLEVEGHLAKIVTAYLPPDATSDVLAKFATEMIFPADATHITAVLEEGEDLLVCTYSVISCEGVSTRLHEGVAEPLDNIPEVFAPVLLAAVNAREPRVLTPERYAALDALRTDTSVRVTKRG